MTSPYISPGNRKMSAATWSLPSRRTCPGCTPLCRRKCYARKAEYAYPGAKPSRRRNLKASRADTFVAAMIRSIQARKPAFFRIHESGDFYDQPYADKWFAICRALPDVRFLAFTKSFHLDFTARPENLQIIWSVFPDTDLTKIPTGPRAYAGDFTPRTQTRECPGGCDDCGLCWQLSQASMDVHFPLH